MARVITVVVAIDLAIYLQPVILRCADVAAN
jgi:hypothetical protein